MRIFVPDTVHYNAAILAAGKGTRMKNDLPKCLAPLAGRPMLFHITDVLLQTPSCEQICFVLGFGTQTVAQEIESWKLPNLRERTLLAIQKDQKGTGDAVGCAYDALSSKKKPWPIVILSADTPLVTKEVLQNLLHRHKKQNAHLTVGTMTVSNPTGYGRIFEVDGCVSAIVEEREASPKEKEISTVNGGIYVVEPDFLQEFLPKLKASKQTGEIYFTDTIALGSKAGKKIVGMDISEEYLMGVNTMEQLEEANREIRMRIVREWLEKGVNILDINHTYMDATVECSPGATIEPNTYIYGKTKLGKDVHIESGVRLENVSVGAGTHIRANSYLRDCTVGENVVLGPMAHIRPGTTVGKNAKIGNFVELKKSHIGNNVKISHLSYVGDTQVGDGSNLSCGFITCNFDGVKKHKTTIGENVFIGSDVQTIAPITIEDNAYIAAGSTIHKDVSQGDFAIARSQQTNKEGMAKRFLARKKS